MQAAPNRFLPALAIAVCAAVAGMPGTTAAQTVRTETVAEWPAPSWLENVDLGPDNALYMTDFHGRRLLRWDGSGAIESVASLDVYPWGLAVADDGAIYFCAADVGITGPSSPPVTTLYRKRPGQSVERVMHIEGSQALNGMTMVGRDRLLIADGRGGVVWQVDAAAKAASVFARSPLLDVPQGFTAPTPAANGVKLHRGHVYVSNTASGQIVRVRVDAATQAVGAVEVFADKVRSDDFVFSPAGTLLTSTHRDKLIAVDREGRATELSGTGAEVVGSTAVVWRRNGEGPYVITDGGYIFHHWYKGPPPLSSKLVRVHGID